jgi:tetratricopeptide (TPR) repeat protein
VDYDRLRELQEKFEENPRRYFAPLANEYRKGGQHRRAIEICRAHLTQMPGHMSGQIVFGQALFEAGEWDEARAVFERALALDPENLIALRSLGDMSLQAGNTGEARDWYARLLDADPKDTAVIALVAEISASTVAAAPPPPETAVTATTATTTETTETAEIAAATGTPEVDAESPTVASDAGDAPLGLEGNQPAESVEPGTVAQPMFEETAEPMEGIMSSRPDDTGALGPNRDDADALDAWAPPPDAAVSGQASSPAEAEPADAGPAGEERTFTGASAEPFVNETMAQLYLQQGYKQLALKVYRQLSASRPHDQALKDRIEEIEAADAAEHPGETPPVRREEPSIERPAEPAAPRSPSIESPTPSSQPSHDRESIESPAREEPRAEPEGIAARQPSIREFFATLGRRRPPRAPGNQPMRSGNSVPADSGASFGNPAPAASLDSVFAGATVSPSDARAASRLAGAFSGATGASRTPPTPPMPTPRVNPRLPQAQESEEDVAKFRAWLDGLTRE